MTSFVVKANNAYKAAPQRDAVNEALNSVLKTDGSFDLDSMLKNYPKEFECVLCLVSNQISKDASLVAPPSINVKVAKNHEKLFAQLEEPIFKAIKRAVEVGEDNSILHAYAVKKFFMSRAVLTDLPNNLKEKALAAAKTAHGENYDTTDLENNSAKLNTIFNRSNGKIIVSFNIMTFKFIKY